MYLYDAKVRLLGSLNNEVRKTDLTPAEIAILQRIHGADAVADVKKVGQVAKRTDRSERNRLLRTYRRGPSADGKTSLSGESFLDSILGVGTPLAKEYVPPAPVESLHTAESEPGDEKEEVVRFDDEGDVIPDEPIKVVSVPKKAASAAAEDPLG